MNTSIEQIKKEIAVDRQALLTHPLYKKVERLDQLQLFTEQHVYAVFDFMSLLKTLQQLLTCVQVPWVPVGHPNTRYLINEIVLGEESDVDEHGVRRSHFEMYVNAMQQLGASTAAIEAFLEDLKKGMPIQEVIKKHVALPKVQAFLEFTFEVIATQKAHVVAAVFTFGREDLIPEMFMNIVKELSSSHPEKINPFKYYLERHIEVDGDHHSHLAIEMVTELCGDDENKWREAAEYAKRSIQHRYQLWDAILELI